jgi:hypothetical protein
MRGRVEAIVPSMYFVPACASEYDIRVSAYPRIRTLLPYISRNKASFTPGYVVWRYGVRDVRSYFL